MELVYGGDPAGTTSEACNWNEKGGRLTLTMTQYGAKISASVKWEILTGSDAGKLKLSDPQGDAAGKAVLTPLTLDGIKLTKATS